MSEIKDISLQLRPAPSYGQLLAELSFQSSFNKTELSKKMTYWMVAGLFALNDDPSQMNPTQQHPFIIAPGYPTSQGFAQPGMYPHPPMGPQNGPQQQPFPQQNYPGYGQQQQPFPQQNHPGYGQQQQYPGNGANGPQQQPYPQQNYPGYGQQLPYPQQNYPGYGQQQQPFPQQNYPGYGQQQQPFPQQNYPGYGQQQQYPGNGANGPQQQPFPQQNQPGYGQQQQPFPQQNHPGYGQQQQPFPQQQYPGNGANGPQQQPFPQQNYHGYGQQPMQPQHPMFMGWFANERFTPEQAQHQFQRQLFFNPQQMGPHPPHYQAYVWMTPEQQAHNGWSNPVQPGQQPPNNN